MAAAVHGVLKGSVAVSKLIIEQDITLLPLEIVNTINVLTLLRGRSHILYGAIVTRGNPVF